MPTARTARPSEAWSTACPRTRARYRAKAVTYAYLMGVLTGAVLSYAALIWKYNAGSKE